MNDRYAVMGNPIAHSKSPRIHSLFAEQTGEALSYEAIRVDEGQFAEAVTAFRNAGGRGLNITVPFKGEAWQLSTRRSERAERAHAVNTLVLGQNEIFGENTDGVGLIHDLRDNLDVELAGRSVLILGAGGAVRGVLTPLLAERPRRVVIANRTVAKAIELAELFADEGLTGCGYDSVGDAPFDIIINGTAAGLSGEVPPIPATTVNRESVCYDMFYGSEPTPFLRWGAAHGVERTHDGLGMLVEQAAESFTIWRGIRPETRPVLKRLREG